MEVSGQCELSAETTCDAAKEVYDETSNTCKCDASKNFEGEAGSCRCKSDLVEVSGQCETSAETTCDAAKEVYDETSNTCKCDASKNFEGEAGSCACRSGLVEVSGQCETSAETTCDATKEVYDETSNTCQCDASKNFEGEAGACACNGDYTYFMGNCYKAGDSLTFGSYPQDENSDTPSPLTWLILEFTDDAVLLLSKYVLEQYQYHEYYEAVTWSGSHVRSYLNGFGAEHNGNGFIDRAFTVEERQWIKEVTNKNLEVDFSGITYSSDDTQDKVFLLSNDEVLQYFPTNKSRIASPTAYAIHPPEGSGRNNIKVCQVTCLDDDSCSQSDCNSDGINVQMCSKELCGSEWWLRSPGSTPRSAACIKEYGSVGNNYVSEVHLGLRPALYVYLNL